MTTTENTSTQNKAEKNQPENKSRRKFLKQVAAGLAALPFSENVLRKLFLPSIEAPLSTIEQQKKEVLESLLKIFPEMSSVEIESDNTNIDGYINCLNFWLKTFDIFLREAQKTIQDSGAEHSMYQSTVKEFEMIFGESSAKTILHRDGGDITKIDLYGKSNDPGSLTAEMIHLFQANSSIEKGISSLILEGASTAISWAALEFWMDYNNGYEELGTPEWAELMPIFNLMSGERIEEPSISKFSSFLKDVRDSISLVTSRSLERAYKKQFLGLDQLGQSQQYPSSGSFLFDRLDINTFPQIEYQAGIEQQSILVYGVLHAHQLPLLDMVKLCGIINHGQDLDSISGVVGVSPEMEAAYQELKTKNLIASKAVWQKNIERFSQNTIGEQAVNAAFALRSTTANSNKHLILEGYLVLTRPDEDEAYFDALFKEDLPTALLYFPVDIDGVQTWYQKEVEVAPITSEKTVFYNLELPESVLVRSGLKFWYEQLQGKDMMLRVTQPTILGVELNTFQDFEVKGEFPASSASSEPEVTEQDMPNAISSVTAPTVSDEVEPKRHAYTDLSPENQSRLDVIKAQLENRAKEKSITRASMNTSD